MSALRQLIEAVEADWFDMDALSPEHEVTAYHAFSGSLDAALRLHNALMPGWAWDVCDDGEAGVWTYDDRTDARIVGICRNNPARAWLLAVLRALEAQEMP
jgi:hypothetical protein